MKIKRVLLILLFSLLINFLIWLIFGTSGFILQYLVPIASFIAGTFILKKYFKLT